MNDNNNNNKDHIYTGKLVQQNEFAAINQGPVKTARDFPAHNNEQGVHSQTQKHYLSLYIL